MIEAIIITALIVIFFHACTWKGMVFSFVGQALEKLPDYLKKPLYDCPICMVPWWGPSIVACGILGGIWEVVNIWQLAIIVAAAAGLNTVLIYIIGGLKAIVKEFKEDDCCGSEEKPDRKEKLARRERILKFQLKHT